MDEFWKSALMATLDLVPHVDVVFTPTAFFPFSRKFYPFEFSSMVSHHRVGFCVQKSLLYRLDRQLVNSIKSCEQISYSNDVFYVGIREATPQIHWSYSETERFAQFMESRATVLSNVAGRNVCQYWKIDGDEKGLKFLVVGASNMGNIGDDLIALAIGRIIHEAYPDSSVYFSGPDISRLNAEDFDAVVVGGGGIIYSSQFGQNETNNLSNYLKLPLWLSSTKTPCIILGAGIQGRKHQFEGDPVVREFLSQALAGASSITVRDELSKSVLARYSDRSINVLPDPVFSYGKYIDRAMLGSRQGKSRIAFVGEVFSSRLSFFSELLNRSDLEILDILKDSDLTYFIMSNDDVSHGERFIRMVESCGGKCDTVDLRKLSFPELKNVFNTLSGVITTRFHGLVVALLTGCPVLPIDLSAGKHALLINEYFPSIRENLITENSDRREILSKVKRLKSDPRSCRAADAEVDAVISATSEYKEIFKSAVGK